MEPLKALVIHSKSSARRLMQEVLRARGHDVEACADGGTGWKAYQRESHSLVLVDSNSSGLDGLLVCRRIRRAPGSDESVILFVTKAGEEEAIESALEAGADDYLTEPINRDELAHRLAIAERRVRDLRERKELEVHLRQDALYDRLTGLPNLSSLLDRTEQSIRRSQRDEGYRFAVLVVDLRDFASVNRSYGRELGDRLLRGVAGRLEDSVRAIDSVTRIAADRFGILLDDLKDVSDPSRVSARIQESLSAPFDLGGKLIHTNSCIGIALSAGVYEGAEAILQDAQAALDEAKREGAGTYRIHDPVIHARAVARIELEARIRSALEEERMRLHYQPIVRVDTGRIAGFETLIRWQDPERGWIPPEEFVPVAEGSDLILILGSWVLDQAAAQLGEWRELMSKPHPLFLSVNVSGRQFSQLDLSDRIRERLARAKVSHDALHIEITETSLMENTPVAEGVLSALHDLGIAVHVDDFGTGYSSLAYLCRFPIDTLKIDRAFVGAMQHAPENLEVVRTIVRLGHNLGMSVVAEGVETESQFGTLRDLGCDFAQGYLFSRAVDATEVPALVQRGILA